MITMYPFLKLVSDQELKRFAESASPFLSAGDIDNSSRESIERALFSIFGYDLLYESKARRLLLLTLDSETLCNFARELNVIPNGSDFDIAMSMTTIPWRTGSKVVKMFLRYFSIADDFLPSKQSANVAIEVVEPYVSLPQLFDYQKEMGQKITNFLNCSESTMALVQLPTGAGKTRTILSSLVDFANAEISNNNDITVLWLAHTEELCEQAVESFRRTWQSQGECEKRIIRFWGGNKIDQEDIYRAFIVAGYQKIANLSKRDPITYNYLCKMIDLVVIDEAHKALAPTIISVLNNVKKRAGVKIVGLTATPGRGVWSAHENKLLADLFDSNLLSVESLGARPVEALQGRGVLSKIRREELHVVNSFNLEAKDIETIYEIGDFSTHVLKRLGANRLRNELIVAKIFEHISIGNQTLVFACSVDHAKKLSLSVSIKGGEAATIDCTMRRNQRRKIINDFKDGKIKVLFNYGVLSTGFDSPNIKTIIITRPTTSIVLYSQMIGRGLRGERMGGSDECVLVDVVDNFVNFGKTDEVYEYFNDFWK